MFSYLDLFVSRKPVRWGTFGNVDASRNSPWNVAISLLNIERSECSTTELTCDESANQERWLLRTAGFLDMTNYLPCWEEVERVRMPEGQAACRGHRQVRTQLEGVDLRAVPSTQPKR